MLSRRTLRCPVSPCSSVRPASKPALGTGLCRYDGGAAATAGPHLNRRPLRRRPESRASPGRVATAAAATTRRLPGRSRGKCRWIFGLNEAPPSIRKSCDAHGDANDSRSLRHLAPGLPVWRDIGAPHLSMASAGERPWARGFYRSLPAPEAPPGGLPPPLPGEHRPGGPPTRCARRVATATPADRDIADRRQHDRRCGLATLAQYAGADPRHRHAGAVAGGAGLYRLQRAGAAAGSELPAPDGRSEDGPRRCRTFALGNNSPKR